MIRKFGISANSFSSPPFRLFTTRADYLFSSDQVAVRGVVWRATRSSLAASAATAGAPMDCARRAAFQRSFGNGPDLAQPAAEICFQPANLGPCSDCAGSPLKSSAVRAMATAPAVRLCAMARGLASELRLALERRTVPFRLLVELYSTYNPAVVAPQTFCRRALDQFPRGACGLASLVLGFTLRTGTVVHGAYAGQAHTFLVFGPGLIADITAGQFAGPAVHVGALAPPWTIGTPLAVFDGGVLRRTVRPPVSRRAREEAQ